MPLEAGEDKDMDSPLSFPEGMQPADTLVLASEICRVSDSQNVRECLGVDLSRKLW